MEFERKEAVHRSKSRSPQNSKAGTEGAVGFCKSLQELRDLRSQLHYAADYCQTTFLLSQEKKAVIENTQEYICRAVVTIVDHLGRVSSNLNDCFFDTSDISEADLRIQCLQQRLLSCEKYAHNLGLAQLQWNPRMPRHHLLYISKPITNDAEKSVGITRDSNDPTCPKIRDEHEFEAEEGVPLFLYTYTHKPSLGKNSKASTDHAEKVLPVRDGLFVMSKATNPLFHFQGSQKRGRSILNRKSVQGADHILSLIRRTKRTT